jgi:N-acyl-D-aspartate/D-glutamate deacylase
MKELVARGMCEGALGFSAGLYYAPQSFAQTDEVVALASEAAARDGLYETHLRDEGSDNIGLEAAVDEAIEIGRRAKLPVHIAHIKALGVDAHGKAPAIIRKVEAARRSGMVVTADQYPWTASGTRITSALVPRWALDGGRTALGKRLADPSLAERLRREMADNLRRRGGAGSLLVIGGKHQGRRLDAIARLWGLDPVAAAIRIMNEEGDAPIASFNMIPADIEAFARQPWVVGSSDSVDGHPRKFGSFALRWQEFVRGKELLTPEVFVQRTSGLTAAFFGLAQRGTVAVGNHADVAVIDPRTYSARANYDDPAALASGVRTVVVNGTLAIDDGKFTGALAGRLLRKPRKSAWACPA